MACRHQGPQRACGDEIPEAQRSKAPSLHPLTRWSQKVLHVSNPQNISAGGSEGDLPFDENLEMGTKNSPACELLPQCNSVVLC